MYEWVVSPSLGANDGCASRRQRVVSIASNAWKGKAEFIPQGWGASVA